MLPYKWSTPLTPFPKRIIISEYTFASASDLQYITELQYLMLLSANVLAKSSVGLYLTIFGILIVFNCYNVIIL